VGPNSFFHISPKPMHKHLPRFDCNLNAGEEQARRTRMIKATNVVFHERAHPSALILPIVS
jgi:predicted acyl esterase